VQSLLLYIFVALDIGNIPRNVLLYNLEWNCLHEITVKELGCGCTHCCPFTLNILSEFFPDLLWNTLRSFLVNPDPCLAKVTQHPQCLLWSPLVPSLLSVNVYGKGMLQVCQEVMWLHVKLSPKASQYAL
jgi:hypothetical protein